MIQAPETFRPAPSSSRRHRALPDTQTQTRRLAAASGRALNHALKAIHRLLIFATGLLVIASCLLVGASWRLSQGPIDLGWFADPIRSALVHDVGAGRVSFDGLVLAWEGFRKGVDHPIDLRISNFIVTDPAGTRLLA
jgi:hypothetical protein